MQQQGAGAAGPHLGEAQGLIQDRVAAFAGKPAPTGIVFTPTSPCRSWLASEEARLNNTELEV
ncbi:hypothetical protein PMHK_34060 [Pseudomonas sp. MHK4]